MKDIQSAKNIDKEGRVLYLDQELLGRKARFYKKGIKLYPDMERQTGTIIMPPAAQARRSPRPGACGHGSVPLP